MVIDGSVLTFYIAGEACIPIGTNASKQASKISRSRIWCAVLVNAFAHACTIYMLDPTGIPAAITICASCCRRGVRCECRVVPPRLSAPGAPKLVLAAYGMCETGAPTGHHVVTGRQDCEPIADGPELSAACDVCDTYRALGRVAA